MLWKLILAVLFLSDPIQADDTFVSVNYTLYCRYYTQYNFTVTLWELDNTGGKNDLIAENKGIAFGRYIEYIAGHDTRDGPTIKLYEFALVVNHTCGPDGAWKEEPMRKLKEPCAVDAPRCIFPMEHFHLKESLGD